jgi:hypothetical protein
MKTIIVMILAGIACTFCANAQQYQAYLNKALTHKKDLTSLN